MNEKIPQEKWRGLQGAVRSRWPRLSQADVVAIDGRRGRLIYSICLVYGLARPEVERQLKDWETQQAA